MISKLRPEWKVIQIFESVKSAVNWLKTNKEPDLYFMDIQLTDGICFSIFEQVELKKQVIFTTAYNEYAIQAFKVNSIDYLLKPLKEDMLLSALEKFETVYSAQKQQDNAINYDDIIEAIQNKKVKYRTRFLITGATSMFKINVDEIAFFYSEERITFAVMFDGKEHIINLTLEKLEEQLDPLMFYRANRGAILNCDSVRKVENYFGGKLSVKLIQPLNKNITISRLKASEFKAWLNDE
jgi:DNA-binding LytR/AlgR family response regulator